MSATAKIFAFMIGGLVVILLILGYLGANLPVAAQAPAPMPKFTQETVPSSACLPFELWNTKIVLPSKATPIYTGVGVAGVLVMILVDQTGTISMVSVSADMTTVCLVGIAGEGQWDKEFLKDEFLGPARRPAI